VVECGNIFLKGRNHVLKQQHITECEGDMGGILVLPGFIGGESWLHPIRMTKD